MKKLFLALSLVMLPFALFAQEAAAETAAEDPALKEIREKAQTLYSLGYLLGENLKTQLVIEGEEEFKYIMQGMHNSIDGKPSQTNIEEYKALIIKRYEADAKKIAEKRRQEQAKYIVAARKERNTEEIKDGGILVQTITKGKGATPNAASTVKVHYQGTLIDGTVFDSSIARGEPIEFPLTGVIPCWTKGLQKMKVGGKAKLVCPAETAYGNRQIGAIPANSVLVFEVELLDVK
ncbi:FKBP-type peptidyl-prolyl cis-trans isomerase [Elusimicrobium simillimum]|uniref:FKBP-type peptidyl-prolyl cis-trans isomerase n=1 Tax=Elusimicrobium simillimum TaxID=3143438 RepID=UPI003C6EDC14